MPILSNNAKRRLFRRVHVLPSLLTLGNFACGFFSIVFCLNALFFATRASSVNDRAPAAVEAVEVFSDSARSELAVRVDDPARTYAAKAHRLFQWACIIVLVGMIFDMLDGKVARHMGAASPFGRELDSLADITTFGVAPPVIVTTLWITVMPLGSPWWGQVMIFGVVYASCAALRLARYNIQSGTADKNIFSGMPSPGAAGCVVTAVLLAEHDYHFIVTVCAWLSQVVGDVTPAQVKAHLLGVFLLLPGLLMVTAVPFTHITNRYFSGKKSFTVLVLAVLLMALLWHEPRFMLFLFFNGYMVVGVVVAARKAWMRRRMRHPDADGGTEEGGKGEF